MKSNELRIGNYVSTPNQESFKIDGFEYLNREDCKVEMYYEAYYPIGWWMGKKIKVPAQIHPLTWNLKDLSPIPLTEEWLLKFGFYFDFGVYWSELGTIKIKDTYGGNSYSLTLFEYDEFVDLYKPFQYVHQLQNLYFALTGEELKLKEIK